MASSIGDFARKVADRAETVVGRDWDELKRRGKRVAREEFGYRGSSKGRSKRKAASRSSRWSPPPLAASLSLRKASQSPGSCLSVRHR
jgi:predicted alpha/beta-hydrolase family hydrolase